MNAYHEERFLERRERERNDRISRALEGSMTPTVEAVVRKLNCRRKEKGKEGDAMGCGKTVYRTEDMERCEYAEAMRRAYFGPPERAGGKCAGFRNRYTGRMSRVCSACPNAKGGGQDDDERGGAAVF